MCNDRIDEGILSLWALRCGHSAQSGVIPAGHPIVAERGMLRRVDSHLSDIPEINAQNHGKSPMLSTINLRNVRNVLPEVLARSLTFRE